MMAIYEDNKDFSVNPVILTFSVIFLVVHNGCDGEYPCRPISSTPSLMQETSGIS